MRRRRVRCAERAVLAPGSATQPVAPSGPGLSCQLSSQLSSQLGPLGVTGPGVPSKVWPGALQPALQPARGGGHASSGLLSALVSHDMIAHVPLAAPARCVRAPAGSLVTTTP